MGLCPTMAPSTPFVQRPSFDCRINQLPARKNWPWHNKANPIRQAGYFKTEENHRVQTYWVKPDVTSEELLAHARKYLPFTYPNLAAASYYDEDSTVPAVTKAPNMDAVWTRIGDNRFSRPRFVYWRVADLERYHDCGTPEGSETLACKRGL